MSRRRIVRLSAVALVVVALAACGDDDAGSPTTSPAVPTTPGSPTTTDGGGGMQAGAPSFTSFEVSGSAPCQSGNAEVTMSFATENVVDISIKIGDGSFEETAGCGPNETDVVANIPCSGTGSSSVQLRGCTEDGDCADSPRRDVTITG